MLQRFSPSPILRGLSNGVRLRKATGPEKADRPVRIVLTVVPLVVFTLCIFLRTDVHQSGPLTAAFGLMSSALLSGFALLARWREELTSRKLSVDGIRKRAIDEAVYHILLCSGISALGAGVGAILSTVPAPPRTSFMDWASVALNGLLFGLGSSLFLHFLIVLHLLAEQYEIVNPPALSKKTDKDTSTPTPQGHMSAIGGKEEGWQKPRAIRGGASTRHLGDESR